MSRSGREGFSWWALVRSQWLLLLAMGLFVWAFRVDAGRALQGLQVGMGTFWSVSLIIVAVMGLVGLVQVWVSRDLVGRLLGKEGGLRALLLAAVCGSVLVGPPFLIFPLLAGIRAQGARWAVVGTVLAVYAVKPPMIPLEMEFLGLRFSLLRTLFTVLLAIPIGLAVEAVMEWPRGKG
ncbi:hypothetical protein [uncultured Desulfuromonas sp.]|uniref:hypothetical protein n=1 Tax=uncultured Desulfuromonas sp. TaxID=181013 RepID=UPI0026140FB8|nr:hypothetical protein [uncultured Desulfuromonas sp.]